MKKSILLVTLFFLIFNVNAQEQEKKSRKELRAERTANLIEQTKQLIDSKTFRFVADYAYPPKGRTIPIMDFDVEVKGDTIVSYLPYYGRAYVADYGSTSSPFNFTAHIESYEETTTKKGAREIVLELQQKNDKIVYRFQIFENGSTTLYVTSTNRQQISFSGDIEELKEK